MKKDKALDNLLVIQYQSGDKSALVKLVKKWHKTFCNKAFWLVKDKDVAKDIAQESWKTIMLKIQNLSDTNSFGAWANRIVYTKSLDYLREQSKARTKQDYYFKNETEIEEETNENVDLKKQLQIAINRLPINQQQVIKLFYIEEYSLKQISELLKISVGTAKSRLFHAREKLKKSVKNYNL